MSWVASGYVKPLKMAPNGTRLRAPEKTVLLVLADAHNEETNVAEISLARLAEDSLLAVSTVQASMRALAEKGMITVERRTDATQGHRANLYRIAGCPDRPAPTTRRGALVAAGIAPSPGAGKGGTPRAGIAPSPGAGKPLKSLSLHPESSLPQDSEKSVAQSSTSPVHDSNACGFGKDWFVEFWTVAEGRNGKKPLYRGKAEEFFRKYVPGDLQPACVDAYRRYLKHCRDHDRLPCDPFRFIKGQKGELWREFLPKPESPSRGAQPGRQATKLAAADGQAGPVKAARVVGEPPPPEFQALLDRARKGEIVKSMPGSTGGRT